MSHVATFHCRCLDVRGTITRASRSNSTRALCYCADCQAFAQHLGRADLLDVKGGTDIVQVAPSSIEFSKGKDKIKGLRLSPKGLFRFYTSCCNSPVGNVVSTRIPFVGIVAAQIDDVTKVFGEPRGAILGKAAIGEPPPGSTSLNMGLLSHALFRVLTWKLGGRTWPHPFFDRVSGRPLYELSVLSREEREALRPKCGPIATSVNG